MQPRSICTGMPVSPPQHGCLSPERAVKFAHAPQHCLAFRREHSTVAKLPSTENSEQLYAVTTILPFANLEELDLSGLQLSSAEPWCALLEAVSSCTSLRVLSLKGCGLGALGKQTLVQGKLRPAAQLQHAPA